MKYQEYIKQYFKPSRQEKISFLSLLFSLRKWKKSLNNSPLRDELPWITFDALRFLKKIVHPNMKIFEYGSGGSSVFFSKKCREVVSVEHDKKWFQNVEQYIRGNNIKNWQGNLVLPQKLEIETIQNYANPNAYASLDDNFLNKYYFKNYASFIDKYENNYFDIVFVDGRARPSCIKHSLNKIKIGGFLVVDNSDRDYYFTDTIKLEGFEKFKRAYDKFGSGPYGFSFWGTTFFLRTS